MLQLDVKDQSDDVSLIGNAPYVPHPATLCEPVNLASTRAPPIELRLASTSDDRAPASLSTFQLYTIARIHQALERSGAFLLGDGTGTGKGRVLAGVALEFLVRQGAARRPRDVRVLWLSANQRLYTDARRDTDALDPHGRHLRWGKCEDDPLSYATYGMLADEDRAARVLRWLARAADALVLLDEAHVLRHKQSATARATIALLEALGTRARVVFATATPASGPAHLRYADRLGLWGEGTCFPTFEAFQRTLVKYGSSAMELTALNLKARGVYLSRHISTVHIDVKITTHVLARHQRACYDRYCERLRAAGVLGGTAHQLFFQRLLGAFKADTVVRLIKRALSDDRAVIVAVQSTGEACEQRLVNPDDPRRVSACENALQATGVSTVDLSFPMNLIDRLLQEFGEDAIAEITGRARRIVRESTGALVYKRKPSSAHECRAFQEGRKRIAIISRAGSTGISLHADRPEARPRLHLCVELPWSSEDFVQQCGRSHRSNATHLPQYVLLTTDVPAERRFSRGLVHRLRNMGALTRADRHSCDMFFASEEAWMYAARREAALRIMHGSLEANTLPFLMSRPMALRAIQSRENATPSARQLHLFRAIERQSIPPDRALGAMQTLLPQQLLWRGVRWSEESRAVFSASTQRAIDALRECHRHWRTRATLGLLPDSVFDYVCELVAEHDVVRCPELLDDLRDQGIEMSHIAQMPETQLMNRVFGLSLAPQAQVCNILRQASEIHTKAAHGILSIEEHALRNAPRDMYRAHGTLVQRHIDGTVVVDVRVSPLPVLIPPQSVPYECLLTRKLLAVVHHSSDCVSLHSPNNPNATHMPQSVWKSEFHEGRYVRVTESAWRRACDLARARALRTSEALSKKYTLSTDQSLHVWEDSLRVLVRVGEQVTATPFVGLVMSVSRRLAHASAPPESV